MSSITTRETSSQSGDRTGITQNGSPLTNAQIDANFISLHNDKLEEADATITNTANKVVKRDSSGGFAMGALTATQVTASTNGISITAGGLSITAGAVTATNSDARFDSLGVGTAPSGTSGEIRASNMITSHYSDERLKENIELISNPLDKVNQLRGVSYNPNSIAESFGFSTSKEVGVIAQDVLEVLPEAVKPAPFDRLIIEGSEISRSGQDYMTVQYEKLVPLLVEAIKELNKQVKELQESK
jgi:hypothetical protein